MIITKCNFTKNAYKNQYNDIMNLKYHILNKASNTIKYNTAHFYNNFYLKFCKDIIILKLKI